jgi:Carboxypeptidase regulatory-like domain/TonB dependent receptor/TonB-dependent Receptor Plug Domain
VQQRTVGRLAIPFIVLALALAARTAHAQATSTASISGTVIDAAGGVIPGATVIVKDASGTTFETATNNDGVFSIPALSAGVYSITASLQGFKTAAINDVRVSPGVPVSITAKLEVGALEETVIVQSSAEIVNTQTATVASTLNADQINRMPTPTRNALNAVTFLPGVNVATTNRNANINGLPDSMTQITMDGVSNNDNFLRSSDGFFASVTPRQDAVEAVTVTTAVAGANVGGSGGVVINFQTRSGTNRYSGSAYEYYRNPSMNTNYWFNERNNLPKNDVKLNQYGARFGGPIVVPGLFDGRDKAFFFAHYEQLRFPNSFTRTRTVLNPRALDGWFRYEANDEIREVNVLSLAAANGQISARDPLITKLLNNIRSDTQSSGTLSATADPLLDSYVWQSPGRLFEHQPTVKIDYNLTGRHRLSGSYQLIWAERDPDYLNSADARFPSAPNYRFFHSKRPLTSVTLRSTLSSNLVNELRGGITAKGGASYFGDLSSNGPQSFEDQNGFSIDFDQNIGLTNWWTVNSTSWRTVPTYSLDESVNWQRGAHSLNFGGGVLISHVFDNAQQYVPSLNIGFNTTLDPAASLFSSSRFPGASSAELTDARNLYALLTGRVLSISTQIALDPRTNKYVDLGPRTREGQIEVYSGFLQDTWRVKPNLTLGLGLRYDVQTPFSPANDIMSAVTMESACGISGLGSGGIYNRCRFFDPGASGGVVPEFIQLTKGTLGYKTDWNNLAPSVSVNWRPNVQDGFLRALFGDPEMATIRAGYSRAYERQGMNQFTGVYGGNPGSTQTITRSATSADPLTPWPVRLTNTSQIRVGGFTEDPTFPIPIQSDRDSDLNAFAPEIQIGSAHSWQIGFQRALSRDTAVEIRYVGTHGVDQWSTLDYNGIRGENLLNNGFLNEFKLGMANLRANNAAGGSRAGSFAYFGAGSGTQPLPTYLAYLNGRTDATNAGAYTGGTSTWTSSTLASRFVASSPSPVSSAGDLDGNSTRRSNAIRAGLPANFFVPNPHVDDVDVTDSGAYSDYHALQVELRRRLSRGLSANVNYQYAIEGGSAFDGFSFGRVMISSPNVRHAIKTQWDWTLPIGRGQRFGSDMNPVLDAILGGWSVNGVGRVQARTIDFGNVRLVGMTAEDLQQMYEHDIRTDPASGLRTVYMLPDDVILNTRRAWNVDPASASGYSALGVPEGRYIAPPNTADCIQIKAGDCAPRTTLIRAPWFSRFDIGATKRFPIRGTVNFEVRFDLLNVFNTINFDPFGPSTTTTNSAYFGAATFSQVTSAYQDPSNTFDPGGRLGQVMFRINW